MSARDEIFRIAEGQQGFFTARQAQSVGISDSNFSRKVRSGEWVKEQRGIYRLALYPQTDRPDLVVWSLWSCDRKGRVLGVYSHETALSIHELSDAMPAKYHMTVPKGFRRRVEVPSCIVLHHDTILTKESIEVAGYSVTTPYRTLIDVLSDSSIPSEISLQALKDALHKGMLTTSSLNELQNDARTQEHRIKQILQEVRRE